MSIRSVLYENLSERYYLVLRHILGQNQRLILDLSSKNQYGDFKMAAVK